MAPRGQLYLVPTPIGNLGDITSRALDVLGSVDLVACEDTRLSGRLLQHFGLKKRLVSYHDFNESARAGQLSRAIEEGRSVAVVTDAGSPGISDPAYRIVKAAVEAGIEITALPGPTAIIPALTASGLPTDRFFFEGFLPAKDSARRKRLDTIRTFQHTVVFYESPHRIHKTLAAIGEILGDRQICLAREISKKFEQYMRGSVTDVLDRISGASVKGELVIVVAGHQAKRTRAKEPGSHED